MFTMFSTPVIMLPGLLAAFFLTIVFLNIFKDKLPHDQGRAFAVDGALSKGKARGAGIIFVLVFVVVDLLFNTITVERSIYLADILLCMLTGYFDDASNKPWNEYLKGFLDFLIAVIIAITYLTYNGNTYHWSLFTDLTFDIPYWLYGVLIVILVWVSINVTNCSDGVDGLSATLTVITLGSFYFLNRLDNGVGESNYSIMLFIIVLVAYLWYNATPSTILMGDAGSRAMGAMIAISALLCGHALLFIPFAIVLIFDGGLGLVKIAVTRFLKIPILKNVRCPLHDQARKVNNWSNTQVCYRFAIIQIVVSVSFVWLYVFG